MNDSFKNYSLKLFNEVNRNVLNKFNVLESNQIETNLNNIIKVEEIFNEMDTKLDSVINKMILLKTSKNISKEINFIN
jgi:hypothetical protein